MRAEYYEKQRFTQWWIWAIIIVSSVSTVGFSVFGLYQQLVLGIPFGDKPMSNQGLILFSIITTAILVTVVILISKATLEIKVDRHGLSYRFSPFILQWKFIAKDEIQHWEIKQYFTMGYGVRVGLKFTTYNVKGHTGLELTLINKRDIRLGTQRAEDLKEAMNRLFNPEEV